MKKPTDNEYAEYNELLQELRRLKAEIQTIRRATQGRIFRRYYESQSQQTDKPQGGDKHERI